MILVLGATGFVGKAVCRNLDKKGIPYKKTSLSMGVDLENQAQTEKLFSEIKPKAVINCAAFVGGIQFGYKYPGQLFARNMRMGLNILDACQKFKVGRLVNPVSNCAYPGEATLFKEKEFWNGPLHESVQSYGGVRKSLWLAAWGYSKEYGLDSINLVVSNMYGPEDHFEETRSHALGAMIKKFVDAKKNNAPEVVIWGTGKPVREWLYVDDAAEALVRGLDVKPYVDPINIGVARGISITELAETIARSVGYKGKLVYDTSKQDGAPYKTVDGSFGKEWFKGWQPSTELDAGIKATVEWYEKNLA